MRFFLLIIVAMLAVTGCGGSGDASTPANPPINPPPPTGDDGDTDPDEGDEGDDDPDSGDAEDDPPDEDTDTPPAVAGIWNGFAPTATGDSIQLDCLITTTLDIGCQYINHGEEHEGVQGVPGAIIGKVAVSDDGNVTASGQVFDLAAPAPASFEFTSGAVADGVLTFTADLDDELYEFEMQYDAPAYERPSSLEVIEGIYTGVDTPSGDTLSLVIDQDGQIQASTGSCNGVGEVGLVDPSRNEYEVKFLDVTCDGDVEATRYSGIAFSEDGAVANDTLTFVVASEDDAAFGFLTK